LGVVEGQFADLQEALAWQDDQLHRLFTQPLDPQQDRVGDLYQRFPAYEQQLAQVGVIRTQLWTAYKRDNPNGLQYTQFCQHYKQWRQTQQTTMHLEHKAGEKLFVDFAAVPRPDKRLTLLDEASGQQKPVEVFIAILGCSQLTYVEAIASQRKEDFIEGLQNALVFFGGVPQAIVPDNLKSAVHTPHRYEPDLNETLAAMSNHHGTCIYPARSRKPRDKALVEGAVILVSTDLCGLTRADLYGVGCAQ
jgi:transposase